MGSHLPTGELCRRVGPSPSSMPSSNTQLGITSAGTPRSPQALARKPLPQQQDLSAGSSAPPVVSQTHTLPSYAEWKLFFWGQLVSQAKESGVEPYMLAAATQRPPQPLPGEPQRAVPPSKAPSLSSHRTGPLKEACSWHPGFRYCAASPPCWPA